MSDESKHPPIGSIPDVPTAEVTRGEGISVGSAEMPPPAPPTVPPAEPSETQAPIQLDSHENLPPLPGEGGVGTLSDAGPASSLIRTPQTGFLGRFRSYFERAKEQAQTVGQTLSSLRNPQTRSKISQAVLAFDPSRMADWAQRAVQNQGAATYGTVGTIVLSTYFLGDLTALMVERWIPEPPQRAAPSVSFNPRRQRAVDDYNVIASRNLFSSQGVIPGETQPKPGQEAEPQPDLNSPPIRTTLPFNLVGTIILRDELKSIATIEDKSASIVYPVRVDDEIPTKAKILRVEPRRVVFVNLSSMRPEFVELPEELGTAPRLNLGTPTAAPRAGGIEKVSPTQFNIARAEVDRSLADLNNVLTQARAIPHFENGAPAGYKLFQIVPGSIYDKLGLVNGDVISGLNGQAINDPGKAFEMLSELKTSPHLELQIKRDGKTTNFSYDIR